MTIGVLALQGDFDAHRRRLEQLGAEVVLVKKPEQLDHIDGLVIPGGESGTFLKLLGDAGFEKLKQFVKVKPTFGTCAGAILLATEVENPPRLASARSTSASAATPTGARSTAPFAKASSSPAIGPVILMRELSANLRSKWFSSAPPRSSTSEKALKSWPPKAAIPSWYSREEPWPQLFTPNFLPTPGFTGHFSNWSKMAYASKTKHVGTAAPGRPVERSSTHSVKPARTITV